MMPLASIISIIGGAFFHEWVQGGVLALPALPALGRSPLHKRSLLVARRASALDHEGQAGLKRLRLVPLARKQGHEEVENTTKGPQLGSSAKNSASSSSWD